MTPTNQPTKPDFGEGFYHWQYLELLAHGGNKKQAFSWFYYHSLNSLKTTHPLIACTWVYCARHPALEGSREYCPPAISA